MRIDDDTPEPGSPPAVYPRNPPVNLLGGPAELEPSNFFSFEGVDGSGKSTLAKVAAQRCADDGQRGIVLRLGQSDIVAHALERAKWLNADPITLNLLNWISIFQHLIAHREYLGDPSTFVFADRYTLTVMVRGMLEGLDLDYMNLLEARVPQPRRIFLVDTPPELCLERVRAGQRAITYFEAGYRHVPAIGDAMVERSADARCATVGRERQLLTHLTRSRELYLQLAERYEQVLVIDNSGDIESALAAVSADLKKHKTNAES